uniref:Uncharacterized protein n=1 Tax=Sinocyclocheilus grahami TaxID=75366 RepID=A0A672QC53_SINGR
IWVPFLLGRSPVFPVLRMRSDPARICTVPAAALEPPRLCSMRAVFPDSKRLSTSSSPSTSHSFTLESTVCKHKSCLSFSEQSHSAKTLRVTTQNTKYTEK